MKIKNKNQFLYTQTTTSSISKEIPTGRYKGIQILHSGVHTSSVDLSDITDKIFVKCGKSMRVNGITFGKYGELNKLDNGIIVETDGTNFEYGIFLPVELDIDKTAMASIEINTIFAGATSNLIEINLIKADEEDTLHNNFIHENSKTHTGKDTSRITAVNRVYIQPTTASHILNISATDDTGNDKGSGNYEALRRNTQIFSEATEAAVGAIIDIADNPTNINLEVMNDSTGTEYTIISEGIQD